MSSGKLLGRPFSDEELAAWQGLLQVHARVIRELDRALERQHQLPVKEFDVLITLFNAPDSRLRMSDLAARSMLSPSGLTRLVERLERSHLVERRSDPADARSFLCVLTDTGLRRLNEARATHNAVIREHYLSHLSGEEMRELGSAWSRVLGSTEATSPPV